MPDADITAEALAIVERIAWAIRGELGAEVDAYPALRDPDRADPLNRAFRAVVAAVLIADGVPASALAAAVARTLLQVALRRLEGDGHDAVRSKELIEGEPGGPDDWLAFLILSSPAQIAPLLEPDPD